MAHQWENVKPEHPMGAPERRCIQCGAFQKWTQDHLWMRVVRSYWSLKVGRCPADKKSKRDVTLSLREA